MKTYEYITKRSNYAGDLDELDIFLNEMGQDGWELAGITGQVGFPICIFKREKR